MRAGLVALALFTNVGLAAPARAADPAVMARIDAAAKETRTLAASFTQKNRMKLFRQELTSQGKLYFRAPRQIRWEYTKPDPSVLVLDGKQATMRTPGAAPQVFDLEKDATLRAVFDQLLTFVGGGSLGDAERDYALETRGSPDQAVLVLTPKPDGPIAKAFTRIELSFDPKSQVRAIKLVEKNGDEKEIAFSSVEKNGKLPADAFR